MQEEGDEDDLSLPPFAVLFAEHSSSTKKRRRPENRKDKYESHGGESEG